MMNIVARKPVVFAIAGILLFTFCAVPPAQAGVIFIFPVVGMAIWGAVTGIMGVAAGVDTVKNKERVKKEKAKANIEEGKTEGELKQLNLALQHETG